MRSLALVAGVAMTGACCPGPGEPEKPGDAGDAGPHVDAEPDAGPDPCQACPSFEIELLCDGSACPSPACDAGGGLAVSTKLSFFRPICARTFSFEIEAQCGTPPYFWSLLDGGFPWLAEFSPMGNEVNLDGEISSCDVIPAEIEVLDGAGHHVTASVVLQ